MLRYLNFFSSLTKKKVMCNMLLEWVERSKRKKCKQEQMVQYWWGLFLLLPLLSYDITAEWMNEWFILWRLFINTMCILLLLINYYFILPAAIIIPAVVTMMMVVMWVMVMVATMVTPVTMMMVVTMIAPVAMIMVTMSATAMPL